jgi:hypothetical protein
MESAEMLYRAEISRKNPGCIIFALDQSSSMGDPLGHTPLAEHMPAGATTGRKADQVADIVNRFLFELTSRCTSADGIRDYFHMGVYAYGADVGPAFKGGLAGRQLAALSEVGDNPVRIEERQREVPDGAGGTTRLPIQFPVWIDPVASDGTPMRRALEQIHAILAGWVSEHVDSFPPIVLNITDGEADADPEAASAQLRQLKTRHGDVLVFNAHVSSRAAQPVWFPASEEGLPDDFARQLFRMSSVLPPSMVTAAEGLGFPVGPQSRGFVFNADIVTLVHFIDIGTRVALEPVR